MVYIIALLIQIGILDTTLETDYSKIESKNGNTFIIDEFLEENID